eukprot:2285797-Rhodomonas_salina.1
MCALSVLDACCVAIRLAGLVEGMAEALRGERAGAVLQMTIPECLLCSQMVPTRIPSANGTDTVIVLDTAKVGPGVWFRCGVSCATSYASHFLRVFHAPMPASARVLTCGRYWHSVGTEVRVVLSDGYDWY